MRINCIDFIGDMVLGDAKSRLLHILTSAGWKNGQEITRCYNGGGVVEYRFNIIENKG